MYDSVRTRLCFSGLISCGVNCSNTAESVQQICAIFAFLQKIGLAPPCTEQDRKVNRWVRVYWGSDEQYDIGFSPVVWPDLLKEWLRCASDGCNRPGAAPPPTSCFTRASVPTDGYCAGRTFVYRVCSTGQEQADSAAGIITQVTIFHSAATFHRAAGTITPSQTPSLPNARLPLRREPP